MLKVLLLIGLVGTMLTLLARVRVHAVAGNLVKPQKEVHNAGTALVLGAYVYPDGEPCPLLQDRLETALELYQFVSQRVRSYSKQNDPARKEQIPIMFGRFPKDLPIARLP